jgi:hypothetical protein
MGFFDNWNKEDIKMEEVDFLEKKIVDYIAYLDEVKSFSPQKIIIDADFFSNRIDDSTYNKTKSQIVKDELDKYSKNPILYWITFENNVCNKENLYCHYKETSIENSKKLFQIGLEIYKEKRLEYRRVFSSTKVKTKDDFLTNTLYVGKVQSKIWGRLAVHAGWGGSPKTAGLQLNYWYNFETYGNLVFNYIVLDPKLKYFVEVLERELREKLKPLIGKK